jgi:hypothetical protein
MTRIRPSRRLLAGVALAACLGASVVAMAGTDDRGAAEAMLREVDGLTRKDVATEPVARARTALERGARMRAAGDEAHAHLADRVALSWAEVARAAARAAAVEDSATAARLGALDAGQAAERERAQLEEAIAQSGRLRAQLEALERGSKEAPARTSSAAVDAGARSKPAPTSAPPARDGGAR